MRLVGFVFAGAIALNATSVVNAASEAPVTMQKAFTAGKVTVDGFQGTLTITTAAPGAAVTIRASGKPEAMKRLDVQQDANGVLIRLESAHSNGAWWPWSMLDWSQGRSDDIMLTIGAPKGTEFDMDEVGGRVSAGDLDAPLHFGGIGSGGAKFGKVTRARLSVAGSMDVTIGDVLGALDAEIAGSGSVFAGSASEARLKIAGSGEFIAGAISKGLEARIAGSGDATVASTNGPVTLSVAGSGNVVIKSGRADPLKVSIAGAGDVDFGGEAVNPDISIAGSGNISVGSMTGKLTQSIQGSGDFTIRAQSKPAGPAPASPPAQPTPPAAPAP